MSRTRYFALRTVQTVFLLWLVLTFLFFLFRLMPGDFTDIMLFRGANPETVAAFEERWGLNDPLYVQYVNYLANFVTGDVGMSLRAREPVWDYTRMKLFNSFILVAPGITLGYIIGSILGTVIGSHRGSKYERFGVIGTVFISTMPVFFMGILMIVVFSSWLGIFPTSGMTSPSMIREFGNAEWWVVYTSQDFAWHYALPFITIVLRYINLPTLIMRTSVVEVMGQDFSYYHRMTGLSKIAQMKHLAKHASLPVITVYPISMTRAVGGLVLLEVVFNWPGIGNSLVQAVFERDFPVVQFIFFLVAAFVIIGNYMVDLVYGFIDPRVSQDGE